MCGIAAVVHPSAPQALAAVRRMNDAQAHRGPDGAGTRTFSTAAGTLAFGHRRLAIQDLTPAGAQPMENQATGDVVVFNGEIYNVCELRRDLEAHGALFHSRSDTEVLLEAFARWGIACVDRLHGMFAFALYAPREQTLYVGRDPMGIKPLYWGASAEGGLVVASELRAVLSSGLVDVRVDRAALESVLAYGSVAGPRTMVEAARTFPAATWGSVELGATGPMRFRTTRYWSFASTPEVGASDRLVADTLRPVLRDSVRSHLISDAPIAVFLSGGIDATAIASLAAEARGGDIDTFTVRLAEDGPLDEAPAARRTATRLNTRHHEVTLGERDALSLATDWLGSIDQPSVDGLNTYVISRAAREQGIVVALSGLGGDEMFGGYSTFRQVPLLTRMLRAKAALPWGWLPRVADRLMRTRATRGDKLRDLLELDPTLASVYLWRRRLMSNAQMAALGFAEHAQDGFLSGDCDLSHGVSTHSSWATVRALEAQFYMANTLLRDSDVCGMARGLEIRVPLLDRRVVDVALRFARPALSPRKSPNKPWLVAALDGRVPAEISTASKRGFSLPQARWLGGPLRSAFEQRIEALAVSGHVEERGVRDVWHRFLREPLGPAWSRAWLLGTLGEWLSRLRADACRAPAAVEVAAGA